MTETRMWHGLPRPEGIDQILLDAPFMDAHKWTPPEQAVCEGHVEAPDEDYARLLTRYGTDTVGFVAELAKKNSERKLLHQVLTAAGIPSETPEGRGLCLLARVAIMAERLAKAPRYVASDGTASKPLTNDEWDAVRMEPDPVAALSPDDTGPVRECGCGHPYHGNSLCTGTLYTVSDGEYVVMAMREGRKPGEPCVCTTYVAA